MEAEIRNLVRIEAPLKKGPRLRWERKKNETINKSCEDSLTNSFLSNSSNSIKNVIVEPKTPREKPGERAVTPRKRPSKRPDGAVTPGKQTPKSSGDRFIANRAAIQFDLAHYLLTNNSSKPLGDSADDSPSLSPSKHEFQRLMSENLNGEEALSSKILAYSLKPPSNNDRCDNNLKALCTQTRSPKKKAVRNIPQVPDRVLDAPELIDDFYLNLLDWSVNNQLAVCLSSCVYLWNGADGHIEHLLDLPGFGEYVASVSWVEHGNVLAVGCSDGTVELWDVEEKKVVRAMGGHSGRVAALSWNSYILASGARSGSIHHHDVRVARHQVTSLSNAHAQEVCGLRWSPGGRLLASSGNDNVVKIWTAGQQTQPNHTFDQHTAAVKALAWCPWQSSLLASGGGVGDGHVRFWNCSTGQCVNSVDTGSQVCSLLWSSAHRELVSAHGFPGNQLTLWKYPSLEKTAQLSGHTQRVLHTALSPDGSTVASAGADETIRLWRCFSADAKKKSTCSPARSQLSPLVSQLR